MAGIFDVYPSNSFEVCKFAFSKTIMNNNVWIYVSSVVSRIYKSNKVGAILSSSNPLLNYIISGLYDQKYFERS